MGIPAGMGYPRIAGTGMIFYPWRVAGADAGMKFYSRIRVYKDAIRADFTRCHLTAARRSNDPSSIAPRDPPACELNHCGWQDQIIHRPGRRATGCEAVSRSERGPGRRLGLLVSTLAINGTLMLAAATDGMKLQTILVQGSTFFFEKEKGQHFRWQS